MTKEYDTSPEAYLMVSDRVSAMMDTVARQMESHPQIVGMCVVSVMGERYGFEVLGDIIRLARSMRQTLMDEQKAIARSTRRRRENK